MTIGTLVLVNNNCGATENCKKTLKNLFHPSLVFDAASAITLLVVGILGAVAVIGMPPAAAYALISIGGAFVAFDVGVIVWARATKGGSTGRNV